MWDPIHVFYIYLRNSFTQTPLTTPFNNTFLIVLPNHLSFKIVNYQNTVTIHIFNNFCVRQSQITAHCYMEPKSTFLN